MVEDTTSFDRLAYLKELPFPMDQIMMTMDKRYFIMTGAALYSLWTKRFFVPEYLTSSSALQGHLNLSYIIANFDDYSYRLKDFAAKGYSPQWVKSHQTPLWIRKYYGRRPSTKEMRLLLWMDEGHVGLLSKALKEGLEILSAHKFGSDPAVISLAGPVDKLLPLLLNMKRWELAQK